MMVENAYYSVISPEGAAAILWKHRNHAPAAAEALKLGAKELREFKLIDEVVPEPLGGAHRDHEGSAVFLREAVLASLKALKDLPADQLLSERYRKFRQFGVFNQ